MAEIDYDARLPSIRWLNDSAFLPGRSNARAPEQISGLDAQFTCEAIDHINSRRV
jgi:hypothetical protein